MNPRLDYSGGQRFKLSRMGKLDGFNLKELEMSLLMFKIFRWVFKVECYSKAKVADRRHIFKYKEGPATFQGE